MKILSKIDRFLNSITMYRLVLYGLGFLVLVSFIFSTIDLIHYNPLSLALSLVISVLVCYGTNFIFAKTLGAPVNPESSVITALILFFIISPTSTIYDIQITAAAAILAMLSKYLLAFRGKHLFNPAAISAVILGILGVGSVWWWVASKPMFAFVLILSLMIVRKINRFHLFGSFLLVSIGIVTAKLLWSGENFVGAIWLALISWPIIFFAGIMLTEPLTAPPTKKLRIIYGIIVAILFGSSFNFGPIYSTPELALVIGNIFAFIFSLKGRLLLTLVDKKEVARNIFEFTFKPNRKIKFKAGQYLEFTIGHEKVDERGVRRYFTISSSPTENEIKIGVKFNENGSSLKKKLLALKIGDKIAAGELDGDFLLPEDKNSILVFVAGGIGVTPFRSMIKYMLDTKDKRSVTLFYNIKDERDIAYKELFAEAKDKLDFKIFYNINQARVEEELRNNLPLDKKFDFYISGPSAMVGLYKKMAKHLGIHKKQIHTDYFPGF